MSWHERLVSVLIAALLLAFFIWFVFYMPAPDYMPPYGTDPCEIPQQMKD